MGRRTKLTPEIQDRIVDLIRAGNYYETACACVGIGERTFYRWMQDERPAYRQFRQAVEIAAAEAEARNLVIIQRAAQEDRTWQAAAWYLERKYHDRWGRRDRLGLEGGDPQKPILIADAKRELLSRLGAASTGTPDNSGD